MKIIHINTYDGNGGAGKACLRLNKALKQQGIQSEVWVSYKFGSDPEIHTFADTRPKKYIAALRILSERFVSSRLSKPLKIPFSPALWGIDLSKHPLLKQADIIHIHWINHGFLRPRDIEKLQELNKPIVWTLHDSNTFTGGCHVRYTCNHYEKVCGSCPILKQSGPNDLSHAIWLKKEKAYRKLQLTIIAPSNWMKQSVKNSSLLGQRDVFVIPNTLDTAIFKPTEKSKAKEALNISPDTFVILSGFMPSRNDLHKGTPYLLQALELFAANPAVNHHAVELVVFGNRDEKNVPDFPVKTRFLGTIAREDQLALCYSAADAFVTPSLEDNLPNTVMESLACATPVVAFTTGGIPDMVEHLYNGYLAAYRDASDLSEGLYWLYTHPDRMIIAENARNSVLKKFSEQVIAGRHQELYQELISNRINVNPTLSVITVVYNNVTDIERTVLSVINQTYPHIQYIVIDGGSTDGTVDIIKKYDSRLAKWVSQKDNGIYDAMNKGLALATGDYVIFMNSGDEFYAPDTVEKVFASADNADIYYGETEMLDSNRNSLGRRRHQAPEQFTYKSFRYGMSVSHQAIYIKRSLTEPYDENYRLSADIDWILKAVKKASLIVNTRMYVAKYLVGGMSKKKHRQSLMERFNIFSKHYGFIPNLLNHGIIAIKLAGYYLRHGRTND
ncbi:glycosyltransferase [Pedobacter sp. BS3]|uniref:glycosyltransferase n=1 Tax=Pedobacter sp. BS3 TaxID=2567937 RepID=UPI00293948D4|nr:glycosyltransferase [Pedobacter sp. BS3]